MGVPVSIVVSLQVEGVLMLQGAYTNLSKTKGT